jgi:hypothetical protein
MTTNPLFKQLNYVPEQKMMENLGIEMIQQHGLDVLYIKRNHVNIDQLFMEDPLSSFTDAKYIEMYIKDYLGYGAMADMMNRFGPAMADNLTLTVARRRFGEEFPELIRPMEGDLIYIKMTNTLFEVKYVEHEDSFYQHGNLFYFDVKCERFRYSSETINTGIEEVDSIEDRFTNAVVESDIIYTESSLPLVAEDDSTLIVEDSSILEENDIDLEDGTELTTEDFKEVNTDSTEPNSLNVQNKYFAGKRNEIIDFSEVDPFGKF